MQIDTFLAKSIDNTEKKKYTRKRVNKIIYRGVEQLAARRAHNPKVVSSSLTPATTELRSTC